MEDRDSKYIDYLKEDLSTIKDEIAGRIKLQRSALAVYIGLLAIFFKEFEEGEGSSVIIIVIITTSLLVQVYKYREWMEVKRLCHVASCKIVPIIAKLLKLKSEKDIFHSFTNSNCKYLPKNKALRILSHVVNWILFVGIPLFISYLCPINKEKCKNERITIAILNIILITATILMEHVFCDEKFAKKADKTKGSYYSLL
jgi:hypothetical protein